MIEQLEIKLKEQGAELGNRDITIRALQRNFESLSSMCQEDQKKLKTTLDKLTKAQAELDKLSSERGDLDKVASERLKKCQDALDAMSSKFGAADDELNKERKKSSLLQKRLDDAERAVKAAEAAQGESKSLAQERQRLQEELQKMKTRAEVRQRARPNSDRFARRGKCGVSSRRCRPHRGQRTTQCLRKRPYIERYRASAHRGAQQAGGKAGGSAPDPRVWGRCSLWPSLTRA